VITVGTGVDVGGVGRIADAGASSVTAVRIAGGGGAGVCDNSDGVVENAVAIAVVVIIVVPCTVLGIEGRNESMESITGPPKCSMGLHLLSGLPGETCERGWGSTIGQQENKFAKLVLSPAHTHLTLDPTHIIVNKAMPSFEDI